MYFIKVYEQTYISLAMRMSTYIAYNSIVLGWILKDLTHSNLAYTLAQFFIFISSDSVRLSLLKVFLYAGFLDIGHVSTFHLIRLSANFFESLQHAARNLKHLLTDVYTPMKYTHVIHFILSGCHWDFLLAYRCDYLNINTSAYMYYWVRIISFVRTFTSQWHKRQIYSSIKLKFHNNIKI